VKPVDLNVLIEIFGAENVIVLDEVKKMEGIVKRVVVEKRFGFILGTDGKDYFFHSSGLNGFFDDLVEDFNQQRKIVVTFDPIASAKGLRAANVTRTDGGV
jgi:cold shock CspA family protein